MAEKTNDISESPRLVRDILGIFHLSLAVLLGLAFYGPQNSLGSLGDLLRLLGQGFFGSFSYGLPVAFLIWALLYLLERRKEISRVRVITLFVCVLLIAALFSIFTLSVGDLKLLVAEREAPSLAGFRAIAVLWSHGVDPSIQVNGSGLSGGLLGGLIGQSLSYIASVPGAAVIIFGLIISSLIYGFSLSPSRYLASLSERRQLRLEERGAAEAEAGVNADYDLEVSPDDDLPKKGTLLPSWMDDDTAALEAATASDERTNIDIWDNSPFGKPVFNSDNNGENGKGLDFARPPADYPASQNIDVSTENGQPFLFPDEENVAAESAAASSIRPAVLESKGNLQEDLTSEREKWEDRTDAAVAQLAAEGKQAAKIQPKKRQQVNLFSEYKAPPLKLLREDRALIKSSAEIQDISSQGRKLEETLESFGIEAKIVNYTTGPTITRYELSPGPGVKVSRIVNLTDDIALNLAATSVRIEAPIPGKAAIGVEIPNRKTNPVLLRGLLEDPVYKNTDGHLVTPLGRDAGGEVILCDITKMPHMLIAGATGSGKSVCINNILISLLYRYSPKEMRLLMIDPKIVELNIYNGIPHLLQPVVTDPEKAYGVLNWAVIEMEKRYKLFAEHTVRDIRAYNLMIEKQLANGAKPSPEEDDNFEKPTKMPYLMIVIDELADLMATTSRQVESAISRLMAKARAAGIHVLIATQRPSVDVITGVIKANIPSRIAFAVTSHVDSRTILDSGGAERLLGKGDMLYYPQSAAKPLRGQGAFVSDLEVERVLKFIKDYYPSDYDESVADALENPDGTDVSAVTGEEEDELLMPALRVLVENGYASVSLLQRKLTVGYPRAARMIDRLHELGYVGPFEGSKPRELLISPDQFEKLAEKDEAGEDE